MDKSNAAGQAAHQFENTLANFMQRLEVFRQYSFAKVCLLEQGANFEIKGVLLIRGKSINVRELNDVGETFTVMQAREMKMDQSADAALIKSYWCAKDGENCDGMKVRVSALHH